MAIFTSLLEAEKEHIQFMVEHCNGDMQKAAKLLKIGRVTLYRKLKKHGLHPDKMRMAISPSLALRRRSSAQFVLADPGPVLLPHPLNNKP
jgi:hypothetical protein